MSYLGLAVYGKGTVMLSNVPGPQTEAMLCGKPLSSLGFYAFVPMGCYLGCFTYNGKCNLGVVCDRQCPLADAEAIARLWLPACRELTQALDAAGGVPPPPPPMRGPCS